MVYTHRITASLSNEDSRTQQDTNRVARDLETRDQPSKVASTHRALRIPNFFRLRQPGLPNLYTPRDGGLRSPVAAMPLLGITQRGARLGLGLISEHLSKIIVLSGRCSFQLSSSGFEDPLAGRVALGSGLFPG